MHFLLVSLHSAVGSVLIVAGLYMVLWGKAREAREPAHAEATKGRLEDNSEV